MNKQEKQLLTGMGIDPLIFLDDFGPGAVQRGINYFKASRILSIEEVKNNNALQIKGVVAGSSRNSYITNIVITRDIFGTNVASYCSCPVRNNCKHGVAVLFALLHQKMQLGSHNKTSHDDSQIDEWLNAFEELEEEVKTIAKTNTVFDPPPNSFHVLYLLDFQDSNYAGDKSGVFISVIKAKELKKGGYGKSYFLREFSDLSVYSNNPYSTKLDEKIAASLKGLNSSSYSYYYDLNEKIFLKGKLGELALKQILETGRCYWQDHNSIPLSLGEPREATIVWKEQDKQFIPDIQCATPIDYLIPVDSIHYIDIKNSTCGEIKNEALSQEQFFFLLSAPPFSKKKAKEVSKRLLNILPEADIPLPSKINIKNIEIKDENPVYHLQLHAVPTGEMQHLIHIASLSFEYGQKRYKPTNTTELNKKLTIILEDLTRYKIHRKNDLEKKALNDLIDKGFTHIHSSNKFTPEGAARFGICDFSFIEETSTECVLKWDYFKENTIPVLEKEGWKIEIDDSFLLEIEEIDTWDAELEESDGGEWFEMSLGFELNGKKINMLPLLVNLLASHSDPRLLTESLKNKKHQLLQVSDHQWVKIPTERILLVLDTVIELYDTASLNKEGNLEFSKHAGLHYGDLLNDPGLCWKGADELKALNNKLRNFDGIKAVKLPKNVKATLRDYQKQGYDWLQFLREYQLNGILADDMGLGKTLQTLVCLLKEKQAGRAELPSLIIAPTSLMSNWRQEAARFTPELSVLTLQGTDRKEKFSQFEDHDLILTTYPLMIRDTEFYESKKFNYLILDEAQAIKNAKSKTTQIIYGLKANHRLCLTGTPIENHLGELWSMFHFLMPGYLGTQEKFTRLFRSPIEKNADEIRGEQLRKRIQPFMLRRTKDLVAKELPEKTEIIRMVSLQGKQRDLYETVRLAMDKKVREEISKKGLARSHIMILDALLKLRQVCCDPQLVKLAKAKKVKESAKLEMLMEMLLEMIEEGRKILLFSQFTSMLTIIENQLIKHKISFTKLTGQTRKREEAISAFQDGDAKVFLISLKAGGVGLNLTAADTVIHYDPWWNPAVENQATDRAYRIGQDKPVFVYKLLTENTVEEKILKLQEKKKQLADGMYGGKGKKSLAFGQNELMDLLKPLE